MTTHQPPAQPDYLAELIEIAADLDDTHSRMYDALNGLDHRDPPPPAVPAPLGDDWHDCYRAFQALSLALQLVNDARARERARRAPVPFLPVFPAAQSHLRAILDDVLGDGS